MQTIQEAATAAKRPSPSFPVSDLLAAVAGVLDEVRAAEAAFNAGYSTPAHLEVLAAVGMVMEAAAKAADKRYGAHAMAALEVLGGRGTVLQVLETPGRPSVPWKAVAEHLAGGTLAAEVAAVPFQRPATPGLKLAFI